MVKRRVLFGLIVILTITVLTTLPLASAAPRHAGPVSISLQFQWIRQGDVGIVRVIGQDVAQVWARFQERWFYFYPERGGFTGLISANMRDDVGTYNMQVWVKYTDDTAERIDQPVEVNYGDFARSNVTVTASLTHLLEPAVNDAEIARLDNLISRFTPDRYWAGGFTIPSNEERIGWFGTWRLYNDTYWYRHTGLDIKMPPGTSIKAVANGRVILSQMLPIRGGYVLIDHGWGIYSGYAHMSQRFVVPGQWVRQGDVIGLSGSNGRSSGAHLHWEMAVGGEWVDPENFVALGLATGEVG